jgi:glycosyltransferase involved in cell wall biosynthesis
LIGLGVDVYAAIPAGTAGTDGGIQLVPVPVRGDSALPERLRWDRSTLRRVLSEIRPDLIQVEEEPSSLLAATIATLARRAAIPLIAFSWQSHPAPLGFFARRRAARTLAATSGVIGGNERAATLLHREAPHAAVAAIPESGITTVPVRPRPDREQLVIGFVGRLSPERRAELLVRALGQTFGPWELVIVGTGPEQEAIEAAIARQGLASRVHWSGAVRRDALEETWAAIDCLVMPWEDTEDWVEPHSPVLLEAMASGVTPIVTRAGALPELVGDAGIVVEGLEDLTEALQRAVTDPARCRALGGKARQRVLERYADSAIAARTLEFWHQVIERPAGGTGGTDTGGGGRGSRQAA